MSTIPANQIVNVIPGVLNAGGEALDLLGLVLTQNTRAPIGQILSFPSALSVSAYFGASSIEASIANVYFSGYAGCTALPAAILLAQYNQNDVAAYLRGAPFTLTIPQLQALSGPLTVVFDGYARTATSINLSSATSYSAAAALIQSGLNGSLSSPAVFTGSIASSTFAITGAIEDELLSVSAVASGVIQPGAILTGTGVSAGTMVGTQISGAPGSVGVYSVSIAQNVASTAISGVYGTLTVSAVTSGTISVGQALTGTGVTAGTVITALGTGVGLSGTYFVSPGQTVASTTIASKPDNVIVSYDSLAQAFVITSGILGSASSAAFATGTLAASLSLTSSSGAVLSQGAAASTPAGFMNAVLRQSANWATFMTAFDPDGGVGNVVKQQFAAWVNGTQNQFMYVCWDTDVTPTLSTTATGSLGYILKQNNSSGTYLIYEPANLFGAAFVCGVAASINFSATNGRITFAFREQSGLAAGVSDPVVAANLLANGYNFYGAYATANQNFIWEYNGSVSGPFLWADAYVNQIWLNAGLQLAIMELLQNTPSIPYTTAGYALIEAAMLDPIRQAVTFGAIRAGVPLSNAQIAEINNAAGNIEAATTVSAQGYYIQIVPASPQVRQSRQSPPINFWYADGGAVQRITLSSIDVQ